MTLNAWGLILNCAGTLIVIYAGFPTRQYIGEDLEKIPRTVAVPTRHGRAKNALPYANRLARLRSALAVAF